MITSTLTPPKYAAIPAELCAVPQWVAWRLEERGGKLTKVPVNPHTGRNGSSTDTTTWGTFEEARAAVGNYGLAGVGFVFTDNDPFCGVDLDDCYDSASGEVEAETARIVRELNSYTEVSPSGTGVKIFVRAAQLPPSGRRWGDGNFIATRGRFFTVTGQHLYGTPTTVEERQEAVNALHARLFPPQPERISSANAGERGERFTDEEVLRLARSAKNGEKFTQLWAGEWPNYYTSQSEADLALCSMLVFYTGPGTEEQVDRLFRNSGLYRDKWEQRDDYRERTLALADNQDEFYSPGTQMRLVPTNGIRRGSERPFEAFEASESADEEWESPVPLTGQALPAFPTEAFPDWLRAFVEEEATATQTPCDLPAMLALSTLAAAVAGKVRLRVKEGYSEPLNVYTVTALPPGNRKSAVFADMTAPLSAWEEQEAQRLRGVVAEEHARYTLRQQQLEQAQRMAVKGKTPADSAANEAEYLRLARELADMEAQLPVLPRLLADDATPERVSGLLHEQSGRLAVMSAEGGVFELMAGRYSNGTPNFDVFLKGHAGDELRVDRQGRPAEFVKNPALTLGLTVQPDVLRGLAGKSGFRGRGLLGRFLYSLPVSLVGWRNTSAPPVAAQTRAAYTVGVSILLELPYGTALDGKRASYTLRLAPDAETFMCWLEGHIEGQLRPGGVLGDMQDWGGKLFGAVARIAGLLHLAEHAGDAEPWAMPVSKATVAAAWQIGEYLIAHARAAFEDMGADPELENARVLLNWLERHYEQTQAKTVTRRELHQAHRARFRQTDELNKPLALLVEYGYLRRCVNKTGGRPSEQYEINPLWLTQNPQKTQKVA